MSYEFDFQRYVERKKNPGGPREKRDDYSDYAFSGDLRTQRRMDRVVPVRVIAESSVRFWKSFRKNELLGKSVEVTRRQYPEIYQLAIECADTLDIPTPSVYLVNSPLYNASTFGTNEEAFIIINSALATAFSTEELRYVIGHECGHLHNNHDVNATAVSFLAQGIGQYVQWAVAPATLALRAWSRRAEITCDRAGLLCCKDPEVALGAMLRLAVGSEKLYRELDADEYLKQLEGIREGVGRFAELFESHPYLPKRIEALKLFAASSYFQAHIGERGGDPLDEVDRGVEQLIQVR